MMCIFRQDGEFLRTLTVATADLDGNASAEDLEPQQQSYVATITVDGRGRDRVA
jgi:hypothetical protein